MKRLHLSDLSAGFCVFLFVLALFTCPVSAAVHPVFFAGYERVYIDINGNGTADVGEPYYTLKYDDQQRILIIEGHGSDPSGNLLPQAGSGLAYIFQLWGHDWSNFGAAEIPQAIVGGVQYNNYNSQNGIPLLQLFLSKTQGAQTVNRARSFLGNEEPWKWYNYEGILQSLNDPNGDWDALLLPEHFLEDGSNYPQAVLDLTKPSWQLTRIDTNLGGILRKAYQFLMGLWFGLNTDPNFYPLILPATDDGGVLLTAGGETLLDVPRLPNAINWVEPPLPGFMVGGPPQQQGAAAGGPSYYTGKDTDPWNYFCYIRTLGKSTRLVGAEFNREMASRFMENKAYPIAAAGLLFAALFTGVAIIRRKGLGKGL